MGDYDDYEENDLQYELASDGKLYPFMKIENGQGTAVFGNNGDTYTGEYQNFKRHGKGEYKFSNGAVYTGDYIEGIKSGKGIFTAPDGGKYEGDWQQDKRWGMGTYTYPNGDRYEGEWKNGAKHGFGKYTYANLGTSCSGTWSNGQLTYATWNRHDGSKFIGKFAKNVPAGDGVFVFANKNLLAGQYLPGTRWSNDQFTTPTPGSEPPAAVKPSAYKRATRAIDKCVLKIDSADGKFNIQSEYKGVPNFRRVASSTATDNDNELDPEQDPDDDDQDDEIESDAPRVYGCGQPSLDGLRKLLEGLQEEGVDKVMWINVRDEPVVYIKDASFSPRDERALNRALNFPELNSEKLNELEERLNERIRKDATLQGNLINYVQEEAAGPASADKLPDVRSNNNVTVEVKEKEEIKSVPQVFTMLEEDEDFSVSFNRVPLFDDKSPSVSMFDEVFNVLKEADSSTGIVFNCQMGKGRTTLGMIMASLYFQAQNPSSAQDEVMDDHMDDEELDEDEDGEYTHKKASPAAQDAQNDEPNLKMGEYDLINSLVNVLSDGTLSKKDVDQVINQCGQVQNVREAILFARDQHIKSTTTDRQQFWKAKGASFVERYFYLICFYAFLKEAIANDLDEAFTFAVWMEEHTEVTELISGTTLAHFNWM